MSKIIEVLGKRVMIKKVEHKIELGQSGIVIEDDGESMPVAKIVKVGSDLKEYDGLLNEGDLVHYTMARMTGRCRHNGEEHFIIPAENVTAIIERADDDDDELCNKKLGQSTII